MKAPFVKEMPTGRPRLARSLLAPSYPDERRAPMAVRILKL